MGQKIYKMNLEHFVVPENKYMLKKNDEGMTK